MKLDEFIHKLFNGRDYKVIDGVIYIRFGFKDWELEDTFLKREHPLLWDGIIEQQRKGG